MKRLTALILALIILFFLPARAEGSLAADGAHALALTDDGVLWAWGSNQRGESLPGSADARILTPARLMDGIQAVACGRQFSLALTNKGTLLIWGDNSQGQIPGLAEDRADAPFAAFDNAVRIAACESRAALVNAEGQAIVWGDGLPPFCALEDAADVAVARDLTLILTRGGEVFALPAGEAGIPEKILDDCSAVFACGQSAYARRRDDTVVAWGANGTEGRLGLNAASWVEAPAPLALGDVRAVYPGLTAGAAICGDGDLYVWGTLYSYVTHFDENGAPDASLLDEELICYGSAPIRLSGEFACAAFGDAFAVLMLQGGSICTFGSNDQGQIGDGTYTAISFLPSEDEEGENEIAIEQYEQRVFPAYLSLS